VGGSPSLEECGTGPVATDMMDLGKEDEDVW